MTRERRSRKGASSKFIIRWTDRAVSDLEAIGDFIANDSPAAAARWIDVLVATAGRAARAPMAGRRVPEIGRDDIRELFARTYRVVYRIRDKRVEILTIFEGHRRLRVAIDSEDS